MHKYFRGRRAAALAIAFVTGVSLLLPALGRSASFNGTDIGDATIASNVTTNDGSTTPLQASAGTFRALLKFNTAIPSGSTVTGAQLVIHPTATLSSGGIEVHPELDSWAESSVVWGNQPTWNTTILATSATPVSGVTMSINLPISAINASGNTNLGLRYSVSGIIAKFSSREDTANAPQLVLTYSTTSPSPSVSPSPSPSPSPSASPSPSPGLTATDIGDTYVRSDQSSVNFGTSTILVGRTSPEIDSYLKFNVSGLSQPPVKAVLRLWAETTGTTSYKVYQVADSSWSETGMTFANKPAFGGLLATSGATTAGTWMDEDVTSAVTTNGTVSLGFTSGSTAGKNFGSREDTSHTPQLLLKPAPPTNGDPIVMAAGDIACSPADANYNGGLGTATACHQKATSDLVLSQSPATVITLGDEQYNSGALSDFLASYDPTWGRFKSITHPALGNHELGTTGASGYFNYFGDAATPLQPGCRSNCKAWYSYDVGNWHIMTLSTECDTNGNNCVAGSEQDLWLQNELAKANAARQCKLVVAHRPKWSSNSFGSTQIDALVTDMYNAHTDIYLTGHAHSYERFAPQNPAGNLDTANGITEIVAGTGGSFFTGWSAILPNSVVHNNDTFGALKLVLHPTSADFQFMRDPSSGLFSDSGTLACHQ